MDLDCEICGSHFANKECYFCQSKICSSCIVPLESRGGYTTKCIKCDRTAIKKISLLCVMRRNKVIIGILVGFWIFTVYPIPFLQMLGYNIPATAFQPVLITTAIMVIPFIFLFIAWQRRGQ
jgi:hypothetical protein